MNDKIIKWQPSTEIVNFPHTAITASDISEFATQLSQRDKQQISMAFDSGYFEMGLNHLWLKTINALNNELKTVGIRFIGEMLGKPDVNEDDSLNEILTVSDSLRLSEELGILTKTDSIRLRHSYELITHFLQMDSEESSIERIEREEAISTLKTCIKSVLGHEKVEVAKDFVEFRDALENESLLETDPRVDMLLGSPYFFLKLTLSVLLNAAKSTTGAKLEHSLANTNVIIPIIWDKLKDPERWKLGFTYAEIYSEGLSVSLGGLKKTLLKVNGFDYVPENLRSNTFINSAEAILKAHEGANNFYNELPAVMNLSKLGSIIPTPAIPACISALLCVVLGNSYGVSWNASTEAYSVLNKFTSDRWEYYLNSVLSSDIRILNKILYNKPLENWLELVKKYNFDSLIIKDSDVGSLIKYSLSKETKSVKKMIYILQEKYYGKENE